jgi:hypothetical protein
MNRRRAAPTFPDFIYCYASGVDQRRRKQRSGPALSGFWPQRPHAPVLDAMAIMRLPHKVVPMMRLR